MTRQSAICFYFLLVLPVLFLSSCEQEEKTPAYMSVDYIGLTSDYATQGTSSHKIKDAWIYIDGNIQGVYELPARFPLLIEGRHSVSIAAGILDDGIAATRKIYPFYEFKDTVIDFIPGQTTKLDSINVKYYTSVHYNWYEDFENSTNITFGPKTTNGANLDVQNDEVFADGGAYSGRIVLTTANSSFEGEQKIDIDITAAQDTYLELNYKTSVPFSAGVTLKTGVSTENIYVASVNVSESWNKIYINLSKVISEHQGADSYRIYIYAALPDGESQGTVYLDNLKLIHN